MLAKWGTPVILQLSESILYGLLSKLVKSGTQSWQFCLLYRKLRYHEPKTIPNDELKLI